MPEPRKVMSLFQKEEVNRPSIVKKEEVSYNNDYYEEIKEKAMKRAHERFEKLRQMRALNQTPEEFKEKMDTPAYMRKNVKLQDVRHSSESSISKYNLNDENEILGNNRFLHDNVD
jgi:cell division protein FtsZ